MTPDEINRRLQEYRQKALEHFPLELIETNRRGSTGEMECAKALSEYSATHRACCVGPHEERDRQIRCGGVTSEATSICGRYQVVVSA